MVNIVVIYRGLHKFEFIISMKLIVLVFSYFFSIRNAMSFFDMINSNLTYSKVEESRLLFSQVIHEAEARGSLGPRG